MMPGPPGSPPQRRSSPVSMIEVPVEPWKERYAVRIFVRPVIARASRTASSFDSAPVVVKNVLQPSPELAHGEIEESLAASSARLSWKKLGAAYVRVAACS